MFPAHLPLLLLLSPFLPFLQGFHINGKCERFEEQFRSNFLGQKLHIGPVTCLLTAKDGNVGYLQCSTFNFNVVFQKAFNISIIRPLH